MSERIWCINTLTTQNTAGLTRVSADHCQISRRHQALILMNKHNSRNPTQRGACVAQSECRSDPNSRAQEALNQIVTFRNNILLMFHGYHVHLRWHQFMLLLPEPLCWCSYLQPCWFIVCMRTLDKRTDSFVSLVHYNVAELCPHGAGGIFLNNIVFSWRSVEVFFFQNQQGATK